MRMMTARSIMVSGRSPMPARAAMETVGQQLALPIHGIPVDVVGPVALVACVEDAAKIFVVVRGLPAEHCVGLIEQQRRRVGLADRPR
jgi:hypothetical protein